MEREIHELLHDLDYSVLEAANWSKVSQAALIHGLFAAKIQK